MLQQRKKDYLIRLLEELMKKLEQLVSSRNKINDSEQKVILNDCYVFFSDNFEVSEKDTVNEIIAKIDDQDLLEQYARLLVMKYNLLDDRKRKYLLNALSIVEYLQDTDVTYSWDRVVLREDILHKLDNDDLI